MRIHLIGSSCPLGTAFARLCARMGCEVHLYSRRSPPHNSSPGGWSRLDLSEPPRTTDIQVTARDMVVSAAPLLALAQSRIAPAFAQASRIVAISSASASTKRTSPWRRDAQWSQAMYNAEHKIHELFPGRSCLLRPTMIYGSGKDRNIVRLASVIRRFRVLPSFGSGRGLRAPVHVDDLACVVWAVLRLEDLPSAALHVPGGEVLEYREMVQRIASGLGVHCSIFELPRIPGALVPLLSRLPRSLSSLLAAASRTDEDLTVPDDAAALGVPRRGFSPDRRALGLLAETQS
jgi:nucleoside-diphosphate-sugar epimerase